MYPAIPIYLAVAFVAVGLYALAWSADRFVGGAESVARSKGTITRFCGMLWIAAFLAYLILLIRQEVPGAS